MIESLTPEQTSEVVYAFLKVGVPPSAVARAMGMDPEHVTAARSQMLTERYGTDEKSEAMDHLIWEAYEEVSWQIRNGTPANKLRYAQMILSRSVGIAGKTNPETSERIRNAFAQMAEHLGASEGSAEPSIYDS